MKSTFKTKVRTLATAAVLSLAMAGSASAMSTIIDFTTAGWLGGSTNTNSIFGIGDVTVSVIPSTSGVLAADAVDRQGEAPCGTLACDFDGIGINDDEISPGINGSEILRVNFSSAVDIAGIGLLDLFAPDQGNAANAEVASWSTDGTATGLGVVFSATGTQAFSSGPSGKANGFRDVTFGSGFLFGVTFIDFFVADLSPRNSDFALASITLRDGPIESPSIVPVPAALPLFGTGLAVMGFIGWRRKRKATA